MGGEYQKIGIQLLYIYFHVRNRLCSIYQARYTMRMSCCDHLLHRIHCTQYVRYMNYADYFRAFGK